MISKKNLSYQINITIKRCESWVNIYRNNLAVKRAFMSSSIDILPIETIINVGILKYAAIIIGAILSVWAINNIISNYKPLVKEVPLKIASERVESVNIVPPQTIKDTPSTLKELTPEKKNIPANVKEKGSVVPPPLPSPIIQNDNIFGSDASFVIVVNKRSKDLLLFKNGPLRLNLVDRFVASTGKVSGDKEREGDMKTPEGSYKITAIRSSDELINKYGHSAKMYGPRIFVLNYPNDKDKEAGKNGSNIWIHGSGLADEKTPDTKGCVEVSNNDILRLSDYIGVATPVVIVPEKYDLFEYIKDNGIDKDAIKDILAKEAKI